MAVPEEVLCDSSVALRFVFKHVDDEQQAADTLLEAWRQDRTDVHLLDLGIYEIVNVLTRSLGRTADEAAADVELLFDFEFGLVGCERQLAVDAARVAAETGLSGYDAAFIAAGRILSIPVITADDDMVRLAPDIAVALSSITD